MARERLLWTLPFVFLSFSSLSELASGTFWRKCYVNSIYNFGDSFSDTGNLLLEVNGTGPLAVIGKYPYGMSLPFPPTGRSSDGLLILDYLATIFRLPYVPPYLDTKADFRRGVNFAVAGATALDVSFFAAEGIQPPFTKSSLSVQLEWFKAYKKKSICPTDHCPSMFKRALFFVGEIGANDFNYALTSGKSIDKLLTYVPLVIDKIIRVAQELIDIGAIRLVIPGNFPIGCLPVYLSALSASDPTAYDSNGCLKSLNAYADFYNHQLKKAIVSLRNRNIGITVIYTDYYRALMDIIQNARFLGFDEDSKLKACCGSGGKYNFDVGAVCGRNGSTVCKKPHRSINWDGIHLTQAAHRLIANKLVFGGYSEPRGELWKCL